jgi:amidohydrolase
MPDLVTLRAALAGELAGAVALRHRLHADPHLSGQEGSTLRAVLAELPGEARSVAGTGALVRIGGPGPATAIRAELDALPITERTGAPFAAKGQVMHACGHDVHLAALVAVCRTLHRLAASPLVAVLQPREETYPSGAKDIAESGQLTDVTAMIGAHVHPALRAGTVSCTPGAVNAAADEFSVTMIGKPGHAAYPHENRDAVLAVAQCVVSLQQVVSRDVSPMEPAVLTVGSLAAGEAANASPETAVARGIIRTMTETQRQLLHTRINEVARGVAFTHRCEAVVEIVPGEPALHNDPELATRTAELLSGVEVVTDLRSCGADDFAYFAAELPSLMLFVGTHDGNGAPESLHSPTFLPDDKIVGAVADAMLTGYVAAFPPQRAD